MSALEVLVVLIGLVAGYFAVSKLFFRAPNASKSPHLSLMPQRPWFEVLQIGEDSSEDTIREAYRQLMAPFEPAKMADLQGDLEVQARAAVNEIKRAYEEGMRRRGAVP